MDNILLQKSKFFLIRALSYAGFLLLPVWIQKTLDLNHGTQVLLMICYLIFMVGQWFLLGKEIDHRLKIYFRVNSSVDRVVYRLVMGMVVMILYFSLLSLLPGDWFKHFFWGTWVALGLFYSWPTRGKIIHESVTSHLGEYRFLDGFEKTVLLLSVLLFFISIPEFPKLESIDALKLYFDPYERVSPIYWNFMRGHFFPFYKFPEIFRLGWCLHFYIVGLGLYLLALYSLLRFFVSRRLSILGVFAVVSSWSFSKIVHQNLFYSFSTTYTIIWIWAFIWVARSLTYRTGLFIGLLGYLGCLINAFYAFLLPLKLLALYFWFLDGKTPWYRRQVIKYSLFGLSVSLAALTGSMDSLSFDHGLELKEFLNQLSRLVDRKAFFSLASIGIVLLLVRILVLKTKKIRLFFVGEAKYIQFYISCFLFVVFAFLFDENLLTHFSLLWILAFLSLLPLEWVFQSISGLRSKRNLFYLLYILICILDSHIEGRFKILIKMFQ